MHDSIQALRSELDDEAYLEVQLALLNNLWRLDKNDDASALYENLLTDPKFEAHMRGKVQRLRERWLRRTRMWVEGYGWFLK